MLAEVGQSSQSMGTIEQRTGGHGLRQARQKEISRGGYNSMQRRKSMTSKRWTKSRNWSRMTLLLNQHLPTLFTTLLLSWLLPGVKAALIPFTNCLGPAIINATPIPLQWTPLFVDAIFDLSNPNHHLNMTIYGNVSGSATVMPAPSDPNDSGWGNPNVTLGKIVAVSDANRKYTTLHTILNVLSYTPYAAPPAIFCNKTVNTECPIAPVFKNGTIQPSDLPGFFLSHDMLSSYAFTTITARINIESGDANNATLGCMTASITPWLGQSIHDLLTYIPLMVLIMVGIATASAAILSPWGTWDIFHWTSNYGRDPDQLRLITPGFADCLQYFQFIVLSGSLTLNYPGYYQPVVSCLGWSSLMFNTSFVSHGPGKPAIQDGIYNASGTFGLEIMSQLIGMTSDADMWADMMVWLLVVTGSLVLVTQLLFALQWIYRRVNRDHDEDLRNKNVPFSVGNVVRVVFNLFLLPIVAISMFQFVIANESPATVVGLAALTVVMVVSFAAWLMRLMATIKPRSYFFDDLPTVLLYGPLYNTYSDESVTFVFVPILLAFLRGIAIGAVQPSGVAQIVVLAICEVVLILTLNAFRPFHSPSSMNFLHTVFAVVRLVTILLMLAFIPSLAVDDNPRGWVGYVILLLHAIVLFLGFFLNSLQTLVEVIVRMAGAGVDSGGATRGGIVKVFGMRQLSRRTPRSAGKKRSSVASEAAILNQDMDQKSAPFGPRSRSISANSVLLLNRHRGDSRLSNPMESNGSDGPRHGPHGSGGMPQTPSTNEATSAFSYLPGASQQNGQLGRSLAGLRPEGVDPYYRPPRHRRPTMDLATASTAAPSIHDQSRNSWMSGAWSKHWSANSPRDASPSQGEAISGRETLGPAHLGNVRERADSNPEDGRRSKTDYATREVDNYYRVRGEALSHMPTRKLKTGPADPTGPVSAATGWFKGFFGGKTKEKGKGFEVVRSSRAPPNLGQPGADISLQDQPPYRDDPPAITACPPMPITRKFSLDDETGAIGSGTLHLHLPAQPALHGVSPISSSDEISSAEDDSGSDMPGARISTFPPALPDIETGSTLQMPSRLTSKASSRPARHKSRRKLDFESDSAAPAVPRKSSKRTGSYGSAADFGLDERPRLPVLTPSPLSTPALGVGSAAAHGEGDGPWLAVRGSHDSSFGPFPGGHDVHERSHSGASSMSALTDDEGGSHVTALERPSSMGVVQQHHMSDGLRQVPDEGAIIARTAEVVDERRRVL